MLLERRGREEEKEEEARGLVLLLTENNNLETASHSAHSRSEGTPTTTARSRAPASRQCLATHGRSELGILHPGSGRRGGGEEGEEEEDEEGISFSKAPEATATRST